MSGTADADRRRGAGVLFLAVEVQGRRCDVRVAGGAVTEVAPSLDPRRGEAVVDGRGGALIPGLHDHHLHLLATAAATASLAVGPDEAAGPGELGEALAAADRALPPGRWIRAVGYHTSVAGDLDRRDLDGWVPGRPVRVQHRTGSRWVLNSAALGALGLDGPEATGAGDEARPGLERDASGRPSGRVHRGDRWLRDLLPPEGPPALGGVGERLARLGVTGVTDTSPYPLLADIEPLAAAVRSGDLPQRVLVTGGPELAAAPVPDGLAWGPVKLVLDEGGYPPFDDLVHHVRAAHAAGRPVAVHCVTRAALALAVAVWDEAGVRDGDRVEHASVAPPDLRSALARLDLTVVTQPSFVAERGDQYLAEVDGEDRPHLYPLRSLLRAGVRVAGSSDSPYADPDPWRAVRAAVHRTTRRGVVLGPRETLEPARALALFLGDPGDPGGPSRVVAPGAPADLCLLDAPLATVLADPDASRVVGTWRAGIRLA